MKAGEMAKPAGNMLLTQELKKGVAVLQLHLDPERKEFGIALRGVARSLERAREEVRKCVLLCANCHAEVEAGRRLFPARVPPLGGSDMKRECGVAQRLTPG